MASSNFLHGMKMAKPILSLNPTDARRRVLHLYKAWYRQLPFVLKEYDVPVTLGVLQQKLRGEFDKKRDIKDLRLIDMFIFWGQTELVEVASVWKQKTHIMYYFKDTVNKRPSDFLGKFLNPNGS